MYRHARGGQHLRDIGIRTKEIVEDATHPLLGLYTQYCLKLRRVDVDVAGMLRVQYRAVEHRRLVVTSVVVLQLRLYLTLFQFLLQEACKLRKFGVIGQLGNIDIGKIEFVAHH